MKRQKFQVPGSRFHVFLIAAFFVFASAVRASVPVADPRPRLAIWCEFMPYAQVTEHLPTLAKHRCDLLLHVGREDVGNADLARLCRDARAQGVAVMAWLLLPYEEHLYVGEETVESTRDLALRFAEWAKREDLGVEWMVFDCEPSPLLGKRLFAAVRRGRVFELARILRGEMDTERFARAVAALNELIDRLHAAGFRVMGSANRVFLDFIERGDTALQDALNAPFSMVRWDRASFITYRYRASQARYVSMVNHYADIARRRFGDDAALDLGLLGDQRAFPEHRERAELFGAGEHFLGYLDGMRSTRDLGEAVGIALGRGVRHIHLYSLEGAVDSVAGLDFWLRAAENSRPLTGLARWTPVNSAKTSLSGSFLNGLFRNLVGAGRSN
jgi:hypothetical protein